MLCLKLRKTPEIISLLCLLPHIASTDSAQDSPVTEASTRTESAEKSSVAKHSTTPQDSKYKESPFNQSISEHTVNNGDSMTDNGTLENSGDTLGSDLQSVIKELIAVQKKSEQSIKRALENITDSINKGFESIRMLLIANDPRIEPYDPANESGCGNYVECKNKLQRYLYSKNKKLMKRRPTLDPFETIVLNLRIDLQQIVEINEAEEFIKLRLYVKQWFSCPALGWRPQYYRIWKMDFLSPDETWMPDIYPLNGFDSRNEDFYERPMLSLESHQSFTNMSHVDTLLLYSYPRIMKFSCSFDTFYFPFDYQLCFVIFHSWKHPAYELFIYPRVGDNITQENDEWHVLDVTLLMVFVKDKYGMDSNLKSVYEMGILLKRKPLYYIVNILVPSVIITQVAFFGFFSPSSSDGDRTEKVNLGMGTLLAMSVLLLTISGMTPINSTYIPLTGIFFLVSMFLITMGIIMTTIIMTVHQRGKRKKRVPKKIQKILFFQVAPKIGLKIPTVIRQSWDSESENAHNFGASSSIEGEEIMLLRQIPEVNKLTQQIDSMFEKRRRELAEVEYIFLAKILDGIMLLSFSTMLYIATGCFIFVGCNQPIPKRNEYLQTIYRTERVFSIDMELYLQDFKTTFNRDDDGYYPIDKVNETCRILGCRSTFMDKVFRAKRMDHYGFIQDYWIDYYTAFYSILPLNPGWIKEVTIIKLDYFKRADENRDSRLNRKEFAILVECGSRKDEMFFPSFTNETETIMFLLHDANADNFISLVEVLYYRNSGSKADQRQRLQFLANRDGRNLTKYLLL